ncbi:high frequency lysogenization protein HflD [Thalassotalea sp. M1531]|uniref:High frequency lysogenization protein HflD homolog n=1 Tax=Thalassotalea algicola TaxID=2716224 RepID=A0A7Y0Q8Q3_9GAMM|nr:high frequency lysogenization protein HflD [Thalassotalea algicola]NMP32405.1 high frequency lysogenization protein HflD [Thalassotalea algicola]
MNDQTLTFAAICQIASMVQTIARKGTVDNQQLATMLKSITITSPENTLEVYGGNLSNLKNGLNVITSHLGDDTKQKDPELTRYIVSLLNLERRLTKNKRQLAALGERIDQTQRQSEHYEIDSPQLLASFASIYSDLISPLGARIQVAGEPVNLKQESNQHKIRALLLAGIRSAVLWRQVGGKRRNILFARSKLLKCANQLLSEIY